MRKKLKLAIVSTILQFIISLLMNSFPFYYGSSDLFVTAGADILFFIKLLCSLGTLPFFMALYKSRDFAALVEKDDATLPVNDKDDNWLKHLAIRNAILIVAYGLLFLISFFDNSLGGAYIVAYGIAILLGVSVLFLSVEAIILLRKKSYFRFWCNILIVGISLWIFLKLM